MTRVKWLPWAVGIVFAHVLSLVPAAGALDASEMAMVHHGWGRFTPGAWKTARTITETLDEQGSVKSVATTEQKTTLVSVKPDEVILRVESTVEVGGKKFAAPIQTISQGIHGEVVGRQLATEDLGSQPTRVDGQPIVCQVQQFVIADNEDQKTVKVYYAPNVSPYILRRETVVTRRRGRVSPRRSSVEVVALDMPHKVLTETVPTAHTKTVHENGKGSTVIMAVHAEEVPGEVISFSSKEVGANGHLVRRSTMELVDFGYGAEPRVDGLRRRLGRRRSRR